MLADLTDCLDLPDIDWSSKGTLRAGLLEWDTCRYVMDVEGNIYLEAVANLVFHLRNPQLAILWALPDPVTKVQADKDGSFPGCGWRFRPRVRRTVRSLETGLAGTIADHLRLVGLWFARDTGPSDATLF